MNLEWNGGAQRVSDMSSWEFSASLRTAATALMIGLLVLEAGTIGQAEEKRYGPLELIYPRRMTSRERSWRRLPSSGQP